MACHSARATQLQAQLRTVRLTSRCSRAARPALPCRPSAGALPPAPAAPRRALLAAAAAAALLSGAPRPALSNPLDALLEGRRRTNAKFLLGPIRLARFYLAEAAKAEPAEARKLVSKASFDCLAIDAANLQLFNQLGRDVCTYRIVASGVSNGPAARHAADSAIGAETGAAVNDVVRGLRALDAELEAGGAGAAGAYAAVGAALDRFENAVLAALSISRATLAEIYSEDKPGA